MSEHDAIVFISYSGETEEVVRLMPLTKDNGIVTAVITGNPKSLIARESNFVINASVTHDLCPMQLAPTTFTTAALVGGNAMAAALIKLKNFKAVEFAKYRLGGSLAKKLPLTAKDVILQRHRIAAVPALNEGFVLGLVHRQTT